MATDIIVQRRELKYYISYQEYVILSNLFKKFLKIDKYTKQGQDGYFIRSLYFDTLDNKEFEEKMTGIKKRTKYRMRIYDIDDNKVKFETKRKSDDVIIKETAIIDRKDAIEIQNMNYEVMLKYNDKVLNNAYKQFKMTNYYPVVLVDYLRRAFVYDINNIRIVFDKFLKTSTLHLDIFSKTDFSTQKMKDGLVIMEIKYDKYIPKWLKRLIQIPAAERSAISKYCIGRIDRFASTF
jgi:hypothetical protein|tara:strand:- start:1054 stop:1764 length:711 start_codon:yes stop_codon:yes gene_type:complete